jgi:hypothetical protein
LIQESWLVQLRAEKSLKQLELPLATGDNKEFL